MSNRAKSALPSRGGSNSIVSPITLVSYRSNHATTSPYLATSSPKTQQHASSPPHNSADTTSTTAQQLEATKRLLATAQQDITLLRNLLGDQAKAKATAPHEASSFPGRVHDSSSQREALMLKKQLDEANQARSWLQAELAAARAGIDGLQLENKVFASREKKVLDERDTAIQRCKKLDAELLIAKGRQDQSDEVRSLTKQLEMDRALHTRLRREEEEMHKSNLSLVEEKLHNAEAKLRLVSSEKECEAEELMRNSFQKNEESMHLRGLLEASQIEVQELRLSHNRDRQALEGSLELVQSELLATKQRVALFEGRSRALEVEVRAGTDREEKLKRRVHEAESHSSSLQSFLNDAERRAREAERLRIEADGLISSALEMDRRRMTGEWEERVKAEADKRHEADLSRQQGRREFESYRDEAEKSNRASEIEAKQLRSEIATLESHLDAKAQEVVNLQQQLSDERHKWSSSYDGLETERRRLEEEWKRVHALRIEVLKEADSVHAMGVLSSARTLRFDLSSAMAKEAGGFTPSHSRPASAVQDPGHATAQRLGGLVRELQEQVANQNKEILDLKREALAQLRASGGLDEETREAEITRLKGLNSELHRLCDRLQREGNVKTKLADDLAGKLSDQEREISSQKSRAHSLMIDKLEFQRLTSDQDELRRPLEAARRAIDQFTSKLDGAERTIVGQDELISTLKARLRDAENEGVRGQQRPRIPSASPSRHTSKTAWEQSSGPQFGGAASRRDFGQESPASAAASSPLRPSGSSSFTYGPGGWGGVNGLPPASPSTHAEPSGSIPRASSGRSKKQTFLMM